MARVVDFIRVLAGAVALSVMPSSASACRNPNPVTTLFMQPPAPLPYEGRLYHGRLTNQGRAFETSRTDDVLTAGGLIVGANLAPFAVLVRPDGTALPVYAQLFSSCADLYGLYGTTFDRELWIVGHPVDPADESQGMFIMGQSARSGWMIQ